MENNETQTNMRILVIGAYGGIGKNVVEIALKKGHHITALVRNPAKLTITHPNLKVVKGDIMQLATFEKYVENKDAVISAIGGKMNEPTNLFSAGNMNLLNAMKKATVNRAFFISASAVEISPVQSFMVRFITKYILQKLLGWGYADQRVMEKIVKESGINWTIMRPPRLTNKPATGNYRFAINSFLKKCLSISRADVAGFMISNVNNKETYKAIVEISY
jgi:putative NADH-flavin reductase